MALLRFPARASGTKFVRLFVGLFFTLSLVAACSSNSNNAVEQAELASGCLIDSDCRTPLVCAFKTCHEQCTVGEAGSSPDCPADQLCVASDRPYHVCEPIMTCTLNSDCPSPLVCGRDLECRDQCASDRDCVAGQDCVDGTCVAVNDPHLIDGGLSAPDASATSTTTTTPGDPCSYTSQCNDPLVCEGGFCVYQCLGDRDCTNGDVCVGYVCTSSSSGPMDGGSGSMMDGSSTTMIDANMMTGAGDAGMDATMMMTTPDAGSTGTSMPDGAPDGYGGPCSLNSDCPGLVCTFGRCVYECVTNVDCEVANGQCCNESHACVTGPACASNAGKDAGSDASAMAPDAGKACGDDGDCQDGLFCDGAERCIFGTCYAAAAGACDDGHACTKDSCNESTHVCTNTPNGPVDIDGDGHDDVACGGDDCDDTDPTVYGGTAGHPAHPEICDFKDNNCNGYTDEGLWGTSGTVDVTSSGNVYGEGTVWQPADFTPSIVAVGDGSFLLGSFSGTGADARHINSSFATLSANAHDYGYASYLWPSVATDGMNAVYANATFENAPATTNVYAEAYVAPLSNISSVTYTQVASNYSYGFEPGPARVVWNAAQSRFNLAWADSSLQPQSSTTAIMNVFVADYGTNGAVSRTHLALPNANDVTVGNARNSVTTATRGRATRVQLVVGDQAALMAFTYSATNKVRYVILDTTLSSVIAGPIDLTEGEDVLVNSVAVSGASSTLKFIMATTDATETNVRVHVIDPTNASRVATLTIASTTTDADPHVAAQGPGIAISLSLGSVVEFGWAPLDLSEPFAMIDVTTQSNTRMTGGSIAPIDNFDAGLAWFDGTNNFVTHMKCGQ